jgi:hypothetical protein
LIKESAQQRRMQWLQLVTDNPVLSNLLGPKYIAESLRMVAASLEMPVEDVTPSEDEVEQQTAQQAQAAQAQAQATQQAPLQQEAAISQREQQAQQTKIVGDVINAAVTAALAGHPLAGGNVAGAAKNAQSSAATAESAIGGALGGPGNARPALPAPAAAAPAPQPAAAPA